MGRSDASHFGFVMEQTLGHVTHYRNLRVAIEADPDVRLVSVADKVHNARAILTDHYEGGDVCFDRFSGRKDGTLWYYRALVDAFREAEARENPGWPTMSPANRATEQQPESTRGRLRLIAELERVVAELEHRCGGPGKNPCRG